LPVYKSMYPDFGECRRRKLVLDGNSVATLVVIALRLCLGRYSHHCRYH
jgi:hypothetical protein